MRKSRLKERITVYPGLKIGFLTVAELVSDPKNHPLYYDTPPSYLKHWRLWECHCDCGQVKLISNNVLSLGEVQSCGCLKAKKRQDAWERKQQALAKKNHLREINTQLAIAKDRFYLLRAAPAGKHSPEAIEEAAKAMRHWSAMKSAAMRKRPPAL